MATAFSIIRLSIFFASLLCMGMASPVAMDTKDPPATATIKNAVSSTGQGRETEEREMATSADAGKELGEGPFQENGVPVEYSQMLLGPNKVRGIASIPPLHEWGRCVVLLYYTNNTPQ